MCHYRPAKREDLEMLGRAVTNWPKRGNQFDGIILLSGDPLAESPTSSLSSFLGADTSHTMRCLPLLSAFQALDLPDLRSAQGSPTPAMSMSTAREPFAGEGPLPLKRHTAIELMKILGHQPVRIVEVSTPMTNGCKMFMSRFISCTPQFNEYPP